MERAGLCPDRERTVRVAGELLRERDPHRLDRARSFKPVYELHEGTGLRENLAARQWGVAETVTRRLPSSPDCATRLPRDAAANASPTQLRGPHPEHRMGARIDASGKLVVENTTPRENGYARGRRTIDRKATGTLQLSGNPLPTSFPAHHDGSLHELNLRHGRRVARGGRLITTPGHLTSVPTASGRGSGIAALLPCSRRPRSVLLVWLLFFHAIRR